MKRLIPQWCVWLVCAPRRHPQTTYEARQDGIGVIVSTCLCGRRQSAQVLAASRKIRRAIS